MKSNRSGLVTAKYSSLTNKMKRDKYLIYMMIPGMIFFIIFCYIPMYGIFIAFKDYNPVQGIWGSNWVGFKWFSQIFSSIYFGRALKNTILISIYSIIWSFPIPIIFALMLNEVKDGPFKRITQTISYLPHFISTVIIVGLINTLLGNGGAIQVLIEQIVGSPVNFISSPEWFRTIYIGSGIWQEFGWSSIIYLGALSSINPELYQSASIDGANRLQRMIYVSIPGIMYTVVIILILNVGNILNVGFEKIILMYSPSNYETADVISTLVYRTGVLNSRYGFGTAVGLFNAVVNLLLLISANYIGRKVSDISLW